MIQKYAVDLTILFHTKFILRPMVFTETTSAGVKYFFGQIGIEFAGHHGQPVSYSFFLLFDFQQRNIFAKNFL